MGMVLFAEEKPFVSQELYIITPKDKFGSHMYIDCLIVDRFVGYEIFSFSIDVQEKTLARMSTTPYFSFKKFPKTLKYILSNVEAIIQKYDESVPSSSSSSSSSKLPF